MTKQNKVGATIPYVIKGNCDKAIVFVHGFTDSGKIWTDVIANLDCPDYSTVYCDLPGMGALTEWEGAFDLRSLAAEIIAILDELNMPVVMVGQSMGSQVAEIVAMERPEQVKGLVQLTPIPLGGLPVPDEIAFAMRNSDGKFESHYGMRAQFSPGLDPKKLHELADVGHRVKPAVMAALFDAWSGGDAAGKDGSPLRYPVLIIGGQYDPFSPPELIKSVIAPRFALSEVATIANASHWPHVDKAEPIAKLINSYIAKI